MKPIVDATKRAISGTVRQEVLMVSTPSAVGTISAIGAEACAAESLAQELQQMPEPAAAIRALASEATVEVTETRIAAEVAEVFEWAGDPPQIQDRPPDGQLG